MSKVFDDLDALAELHECAHTWFVSTETFPQSGTSTYACDACAQMASQILARHNPDVTIVSTPRARPVSA